MGDEWVTIWLIHCRTSICRLIQNQQYYIHALIQCLQHYASQECSPDEQVLEPLRLLEPCAMTDIMCQTSQLTCAVVSFSCTFRTFCSKDHQKPVSLQHLQDTTVKAALHTSRGTVAQNAN